MVYTEPENTCTTIIADKYDNIQITPTKHHTVAKREMVAKTNFSHKRRGGGEAGPPSTS
jgi:uncharacterized sporulation protein YeaH/YhbH (DUF444 family)